MSVLSPEKRKRNEERLGAAVKAARERLGMTQKDLANELGVEYYTMISQIERGYMSIPASLWVPLAIALHFDRRHWVVECLYEIQPLMYEALFDHSSTTEVAEALTKSFPASRQPVRNLGNRDSDL